METSLDIYLNHTPGEIISADKVTDVGCGMYPCYYVQRDSDVLVSTSGANLIAELGDLKRNPDFQPPLSFADLGTGDQVTTDQTIIETLADYVPTNLRREIPSSVITKLENLGLISGEAPQAWAEGWHTIDSRVSRLRPFETITPDTREQSIDFTRSLSDPEALAEQTAEYMTTFIHRIEDQFPDHQHIILTGGMDSQLISLVPKQTDNWHVFSAEPNYSIVTEFLDRNDIDVNSVIHHDNRNDESLDDLQRKLVAADLMADPRHLRWLSSFKELVQDFGGDCIIWSGTSADAIHAYHRDFHTAENYFDCHLRRVASWQAISHQVMANFVGVPQLSPYHSPEIWDDVYRHYDPDMMSPEMDLRPRIGKILSGGEVWWPNRNPGPSPYQYDFEFDPIQLFIDGVQAKINAGQNRSSPRLG